MNIAIVGATGYAGQQLVALLLQHPEINKLTLMASSTAGAVFSDLVPAFKGRVDDVLLPASDLLNTTFIENNTIDAVFLALPHGASMDYVDFLMKNAPQVGIIDLGADFRIHDVSVYDHWYGTHRCPENLDKFVYGLPEINHEEIVGSKYIGNPGCYPTSILLALIPALKAGVVETGRIVADSKSGMSGAGKTAAIESLFTEVAETVRPYKTGQHRHTAEIVQEMNLAAGSSVGLLFSPSIVPMSRGIQSTVYAPIKPEMLEWAKSSLLDHYKEFYAGAPFVRVLDKQPETRNVRGSNYCDVWIYVDEVTQTLVAMGVIDNLIKGASGQAVQNFNLMYGYEETCGLKQLPVCP
jgi:N-acetyl-gamma-glutamyl-phosphate reductase